MFWPLNYRRCIALFLPSQSGLLCKLSVLGWVCKGPCWWIAEFQGFSNMFYLRCEQSHPAAVLSAQWRQIVSPNQEEFNLCCTEKAWTRNARGYTSSQAIPSASTSKNSSPWISPHPITKTTERYALYDWVHQKKQKRPEEHLRSLNLCRDLCSTINSSVAEQLNQELAAIRYSLSIMNEGHFKQTIRIHIQLHICNINGKFINEMTQQSSIPLAFAQMGTLIFRSAGRFTWFKDKSAIKTGIKRSNCDILVIS